MSDAKNNDSDDIFGKLTADDINHDESGFIGPYQLLNRIGTGAMGVVYQARSIVPQRQDEIVAVKMLHKWTAADPLQVKQCQQEAYLLSLLQHDNIVKTIESGIHSEQFYIVMEFISGPDLGSLIEMMESRNLQLPDSISVYIIDQLLDALEHMSTIKDLETNDNMNLVHRDICPANIFISENGQVLLGDFGIALHDNGKQEQVLHGGHLGYMAPEQFEGGQLTAKTDYFALTAVLYRLLTGVIPFESDDFETCYRLTRKGKPAQSPFIDKDLRKKIENITNIGFRTTMKRRFNNVQHFKEELYKQFGKPNAGRAQLAALVKNLYYKHEKQQVAITESQHKELLPVAVVTHDDAFFNNYDTLFCSAGLKIDILESPELLTTQLFDLIFIDITTLSEDELGDINTIEVKDVIVLAGGLSPHSLYKSSLMESRHVLYAPYNPEELQILQQGSIERRAANKVPISKAGSKKDDNLIGRRLLIAGMLQTEAESISIVAQQYGILPDIIKGIDGLEAFSWSRSFHIIIVKTNLNSLADLAFIMRFRSQAGYGLVPFILLVEQDQINAIKQVVPESVHVYSEALSGPQIVDEIRYILKNHTRRSFIRFPLELEGSFSYRGVVSDCHIKNISRLGALIFTEHILPLDAVVHLQCTLPKQENEIEVVSRVAHIRLSDDGNGAFIGLDFSKMRHREEVLWLKVISNLSHDRV